MQDFTVQNQFVFILGREREIALEELKAVLHRCGFVYHIDSVSGNLALINTTNADDSQATKLAPVLGGTIKIFKIVSSTVSASDDTLADDIADLITTHCKNRETKFNFGISDYTGRISPRRAKSIGIEVKKALKGELKTRFVAVREGNELSSIVSLKNNLVGEGIEIGIFPQGLGILIGLSNPEEWSKRDFGKPAGDRYSGMVPPKLARMMVNITLGQGQSEAQGPRPNAQGQNKQNDLPSASSPQPSACLIVDPFCGSGNILMEAMLLGCDVIGSDFSEKAVRDTEANLRWLIQNSNLKPQNYNQKLKIFQADATKYDFSDVFSCGHSDESAPMGDVRIPSRAERADSNIAIVTEPFLGNPKKFKPTLNAAKGEYNKIQKLYLSFLSNLRNPSNLDIICLIFPLIETLDGKRYSLYQNSVDEIRELGYTEVRPPLIYGREYQVVKRELVFLSLARKERPRFALRATRGRRTS